MILTVDIGNSRIKWALWQAGVIIARGVSQYRSEFMPEPVADHAAEHKDSQAAEEMQKTLDKLFSTVQQPQHVLAVCVAGEDKCAILSDWVRQHWQLDVEFLKTEKQFKNITNAYEHPDQHGADRWAAVVAAHQGFPGSSVCVIGAGTAITFDLVDQNGQHLGGYILPSYKTMHSALLADTANVESALSMQPDTQDVPVNTSDAVNQGLHIILQAGLREICQLAADKLGDPMQIVLTGGFAKAILGYPEMPKMHHEPDLIMHGLYSIMKDKIQK